MMIETLISMSRYLSAHKDDDFADRMNYLYTPNMLLAFSVLISFKQFGGRPLECMFPNKFPGSWEQYAENFCWSEDTYYLPPQVHVAQIKESERYTEDKKLSYYQWVPFFLLLQAACFRIPSLLWKAASLSSDSQNMDDECRHKTIILLANHLARALRFQNQILNRHLFIHKTMKFLNITYSACLISFIYLFTKFLYLANVFVQLYLMNKFLETDRYQWYGLSVIKDLIIGIPWHASGYFPRVSLCDFTVRQMANIQKYSVQCVLVINIFNEKIFILLWFWYGILLIATSLSFIYWLIMMLFPQFGCWYIAQALELCRMELSEKQQLNLHTIKKERKNFNCFVNEFLKNDGVFVIRMVGIHTGILFTSELTYELYRIYLELLLNNSEQHFSENTTLKLIEDGKPLKNENKNNKKIRSDSAPLIEKREEKELKTKLLPMENNKENKQISSSSNSFSSSKENQIESDNNDN